MFNNVNKYFEIQNKNLKVEKNSDQPFLNLMMSLQLNGKVEVSFL